jgi:serine/threonine-protein kinase
VKVPDVFRLSQAKATAALQAAGLQVVVRKSSGRLLDLVKSQTPAPGSVVPKGTTVTITIV